MESPSRYYFLGQGWNRGRGLRIIGHFQVDFPGIPALTREFDPLVKLAVLVHTLQVDRGIPDKHRVL
jgi:hypothetical protein